MALIEALAVAMENEDYETIKQILEEKAIQNDFGWTKEKAKKYYNQIDYDMKKRNL